jgi:hypothetical protein
MLKMLEIKAKGFLCLQLEVANMRVQRFHGTTPITLAR